MGQEEFLLQAVKSYISDLQQRQIFIKKKKRRN